MSKQSIQRDLNHPALTLPYLLSLVLIAASAILEQSFHLLLASLSAFWVVYVGREGYRWFFGVEAASFVVALVSGWPTLMLIQDEPQLEEEE